MYEALDVLKNIRKPAIENNKTKYSAINKKDWQLTQNTVSI